MITATTNVDNKEVILKIKKLLEKDSDFFQFILKIIPIDYTCETKIKVIKEIVEKYYNLYLNENDSFKIDLKRRKNENIERDAIIESVANIFNNSVNLDNPDIILRIELLGNITGISFLKPNEIITISSKTNQL